MRRAMAVLAAAALMTTAGLAVGEDRPYPAGESSHEIEGLRWSIFMPDAFDAAQERSLIVVLHGAGGSEVNMARSLMHLAKDDYVIAAPKAVGQVWEPSDLERVRTAIAGLKERLNVGETRLHAVGYSNGGWNLAPVAFDEELRFSSACWIAAGYRGAKVPKHAEKGLGVLALAGSEDGNRDAAENTPRLLRDKVRSAEVRLQPGLGHKWPRELMPYYDWWVGVQEGRFEPGVTLAFEWEGAKTDPPPRRTRRTAASSTGTRPPTPRATLRARSRTTSCRTLPFASSAVSCAPRSATASSTRSCSSRRS